MWFKFHQNRTINEEFDFWGLRGLFWRVAKVGTAWEHVPKHHSRLFLPQKRYTPLVKNHCCCTTRNENKFNIWLISQSAIFCKNRPNLSFLDGRLFLSRGAFVMYIFLPTIWWGFVLFRKNAQMLQLHFQLIIFWKSISMISMIQLISRIDQLIIFKGKTNK